MLCVTPLCRRAHQTHQPGQCRRHRGTRVELLQNKYMMLIESSCALYFTLHAISVSKLTKCVFLVLPFPLYRTGTLFHYLHVTFFVVLINGDMSNGFSIKMQPNIFCFLWLLFKLQNRARTGEQSHLASNICQISTY